MNLETVTFEVDQGVASLVLNRPESLNALNARLGAELGVALRSARDDSAVRVVVLSGAGRGFCAGGDLKEMAAGLSGAGRATSALVDILRNFHDVVSLLHGMDKPTIAAIHGPAVGAGMSIALAADLRIASEDATFSQAFVRIGLSPDGGSTWLLPRVVGPARAAQLMMTGETLGARSAYEWGIVSQLVPQGEHMTRALETAKHLADHSPHALASIKRLMRKSERNMFEDQLEAEAAEQGSNSSTAQFRASLEAFLKRK